MIKIIFKCLLAAGLCTMAGHNLTAADLYSAKTLEEGGAMDPNAPGNGQGMEENMRTESAPKAQDKPKPMVIQPNLPPSRSDVNKEYQQNKENKAQANARTSEDTASSADASGGSDSEFFYDE